MAASAPNAAGSPDDASGGSRARDHLANERTYLAWLRTSANVMVVGLAIARLLDNGNGPTRAVVAGLLLVVVGAAGIVEGMIRYRRIGAELERGRFDTGSRGREPVIAGGVLLLAVVMAMALLV